MPLAPEEIIMMSLNQKLPPDLQDAVELLIRVAVKNNFVLAGMIVAVDPPTIAAIGNVKERGHDFAELLRRFAEIMDDAADQGTIVDSKVSKPM
jgi:small nuclear ribonucleoprotein (snRNP)-like protein